MNVGIIGLGVGAKHLESLKKNKYINKIKVYDYDKKKVKYYSKKFQVLSCNNEDEIFKDRSINLVCIASYDNFHYGQIKKSIINKKHIFVEKPAVDSFSSAKKILNLLKKNKKIFFCTNYILRKSPRFIQIKKLIKKNYLGKIYYIESDYNYGRVHKLTNGWRGKIPFYSITNGGGVHIIDLVNFLFESKIIEIKSYANKIVTKKTRFKYPDCIVTIAKFQNGAIGKFVSNFGCVYPHFHKLNLYGTKKTFENYLNKGIFFNKRDKNKFISIKSVYKTKKSLLLNEFINSVRKGLKRQYYINNAFNALSVCFSIDKSFKQNKSIKINYLK